jgi:23S rRNA pseudouridine1911/1915/1917 synthase
VELEIVYSDNHLLVVNKPPGLLTQPVRAGDDSLETRAKAWIKEAKGKPGAVYLHAVHRLDRPASGLVLFARTGKALSRLNEEMRAGRVRKGYHAVTRRAPAQRRGTAEHYLVHDDHAATVVPAGRPGGRRARLEYEIVKEERGIFLWAIRLETGRYHQIRAQLAALGCPIAGDGKYGDDRALPGGVIALHHRTLEFRHPTRNETVSVTAGYPPAWPGPRQE